MQQGCESPNLTLWTQLRAEDPGAAARDRHADEVQRAQATRIVAQLNVLDTDRDGWLDEDDLPYDQLMLLERARASEPAAEEPRRAAPPRCHR